MAGTLSLQRVTLEALYLKWYTNEPPNMGIWSWTRQLLTMTRGCVPYRNSSRPTFSYEMSFAKQRILCQLRKTVFRAMQVTTVKQMCSVIWDSPYYDETVLCGVSALTKHGTSPLSAPCKRFSFVPLQQIPFLQLLDANKVSFHASILQFLMGLE